MVVHRTSELSDSAPECAHHWLIEPQGGPRSDAVCKRCGAVREFRNSADDGPGAWGNNRRS